MRVVFIWESQWFISLSSLCQKSTANMELSASPLELRPMGTCSFLGWVPIQFKQWFLICWHLEAPGTCYCPINNRNRDSFSSGSVLVWVGIIIDGCTDLHIFQGSSVTALRWRWHPSTLCQAFQSCQPKFHFYGW